MGADPEEKEHRPKDGWDLPQKKRRREGFLNRFFVGFFSIADSGKYVGITNKRSRFLCNIYRQRC